jgi:hypothetical protein
MDKLRASPQISRLSADTDNRGTTLRRLGETPVMDSAVQVELHRQAKVIMKGSQISPNKYRKQEERLENLEEQALRHPTFVPPITETQMIRKLASGQYRLYSRKKDKSGKRKNLGTFKSLAAAKKHERAVQYFKRAG